MDKSRGNRSQARDADGRFESKNQAQNKSGNKPMAGGAAHKGGSKSGDRCRDDQGRYESCE